MKRSITMRKARMSIKKAIFNQNKMTGKQVREMSQSGGMQFNYFKHIRDFEVLSREEELELIRRVKAGDPDAYQAFVNANLKLVVSIAKTFHANGMRREDWIQEGNIALLTSIDKFEPEYGNKFSTYATVVIRRHLTEIKSKNMGMLSAEKSMIKEIARMKKVIAELEQTGYFAPKIEEIALAMECSEERVREIKKAELSLKAASIDATVNDDNKTTLEDMLAAPESYTEPLIEEVKEILKGISDELVRKIIVIFFEKELQGIEVTEKIYEEIGKELNISGERVRQIVNSYKNYQKKNKAVTLVDGKYPNALDQYMVHSRSGIGTGHTVEAYGSLKKWSAIDDEKQAMKNWDMFYRSKNTVELLKNIVCTDFHVYFVRYLLERFSNLFPNVTPEMIYKDEKVRMDLISCIEKECTLNGYSKRVPVKKYLSAKKLTDAEFFELALAIDMAPEDVETFLHKVQLRSTWNFFDSDEVIYYIALKYVEGDKMEFISKAKKLYDQAEPKQKVKVPKLFNTIIYKNQIEQMLEDVQDCIMVFDSADDVMKELEALFSHMKYMETDSNYVRSASEKFLELSQNFSEMIKLDQGKTEELKKGLEKKTDVDYVSGSIQIQYDCRKGLEILEGQRFIKKDGKNKLYYTVTQDVKEKASNYFEVEVPVMCTQETEVHGIRTKEQEIGSVPGKSEFEHDLIYVVQARNKSGFKANGDVGTKTNVSGKITLKCDVTQCDIYNQSIPEGTLFQYDSFVFATTKEVSLLPTVSVKVRGTEMAKQDTIHELEEQEKYPQIIGMAHARISSAKAAREKKENKEAVSKEKDSMVSVSKKKENLYLYHTAGGSNSYYVDLEKIYKSKKLRDKLYNILKGTAMDPSAKASRIKDAIKSSNGKKNTRVSRQELLTLAFLTEMAKEQFTISKERIIDPEERLANRIQRINFIMNSCGFYGIYPANPYDCLMLYISTFEKEPIYVYRNLWGNVQDYVTGEN